MNTTSLPRVLIGLGILAVGVLAALGAVDIINFSKLAKEWWPIVPIFLGVVMLLSRNYLWGLLVAAFGGAMLIRSLGYTDYNVFELFWPAIIIVVGLSILFNRSASTLKTDKTHDDVTAILGGINSNNTSSDYHGGRATAVMGGVSIDLRKATIKKEATLQVMSFWGGVEIKVPKNWVVKNRVSAILGGVEVKSPADTDKDAPILYIVGDVIMAGVEVKQ
jgi:predicted membrane protein